eukprot:1276235-Alexandrium_andersonii.AAC.1
MRGVGVWRRVREQWGIGDATAKKQLACGSRVGPGVCDQRAAGQPPWIASATGFRPLRHLRICPNGLRS